jgi:putative hydrolase of the HAD superfamily
MPFIRKYDHLFFDLDNTLWDFDVNARLAMQQAVTTLKLNDQIGNFDSFFTFFEQTNNSLWEAYRNREIRQSELVLRRFEIMIGNFGLTGINPEKFNDMYLRLMPAYNHLVDGAVETLDYLRDKGYQMHIITNGLSEVQQRKVKSSDLAPYFEKIFVSEDINIPKPDKRIFQHALINCNAKKNKSMMIGDTWETDIVGARQTGIDHIFFIRNEKKSDTPPENEIQSLENNKFSSTSPFKSYYNIKKLTNLKQIL